MRKLLLLALLTVVVARGSLAAETLMCGAMGHGASGGGHHGISFGPVVKLTTFNGDFAVLAGAQAGWTIDRTFMLGAAYYGLATEHHPSRVPDGYPWPPDEALTDMRYGGMLLSYIGFSDRVLHPTIDLLIGGGDVDHDWDTDRWSDGNYHRDHHGGDGFFVVEPTVNAQVNVAPFMRADIGAGYRLVSGISGWGLSNNDVGGPSASLALRFGRF